MATDLELEISGTHSGEYEVRVVRAAAGGAPRAALRLDVDALLAQRSGLEDKILASAVSARRVVPATEEPVRRVGQDLFEALFTGPIRGTYRASRGVAQERQERLRVVLRLVAPELALLPWEALFDPETDAYLCRHEPLVRHVPAPYTPEPLQVTPPLRILVAIASPRGRPPLDTDAEQNRLQEALAGQIDAGRVELAWVPRAGWDSLHRSLLERQWHVLHFIGHGDYDPDADEGLIDLVDDNGGPDPIEASRLADLLGEAEPTPRLVVLNSCASAQGGTRDVFSSTGAALVRSGISAVAAMQFTVSDRAAVRFAHGLYTALASGRRIDEAARSGRIAILGAGRSTLEWITPVLYVRGESTRLFTFTAPPPPPPGDGRREAQLHAIYAMASTELRAGHHDEAIALLDDLLTLDPDNRDAAALRDTATRQRRLADLYQRAADAETASDWRAAIDAYTETLAADPGYRDAAPRREVCRVQKRIAELQAELRHHADTDRWQAVLDVSEELHRLDPATADPNGLAARARQALHAAQPAADLESGYAEARAAEGAGHQTTAKIAKLRTALLEQAAARDWARVSDTVAELTALHPHAAQPYAVLADRARSELIVPQPIELVRFQPQAGAVALSWDPSGRLIAVTGSSKVARIYDTAGEEKLKVKAADTRSHLKAVAFSPDGAQLAAGSNDRIARIWDAATGRQLHELHHDGKVNAVAFNPDGTRLATGSTNRTAQIWETATGQHLLDVRHRAAVMTVAFSPDGTRLATGVMPRERSFGEARGDRIVTGGNRGTVRIWDAATGRQLLDVHHNAAVNAVAFSPDGTRLAAASDDRTVRIWDAATGQQLHELHHDTWVNAVAFSPDGTRLATGSTDRTVRIWDATTGQHLHELHHDAALEAVAYSPDGTRLATCSWKTVSLWLVGDV